MVLTTRLVCLWKAMGRFACDSRGVLAIGRGLVVIGLVMLTGCGTGENMGDGVLAAGSGKGQAKGLRSTISMSQTSLSFSAIQGGSNPPGQAVAISNSGNGSLNWTLSTEAPWLALSSLAGAAPGSFNVTAIVAGLAAGTYSATIIVSATGATNTPQTIPVTLTVSASTSTTSASTISNAAISLNPASLSFSAIQGGSDPAGKAVAISNSGSGTLTWSVSTTASWLALSPFSGTAPSSFNATAYSSGLAAGTYSATIIVSATGATNTSQTIPVTLTVSASTSTTSTSTSTTSSTTSTSTTTTSTTTIASASLAWDAGTDPSVVGYYVHYGTQSPNSAGSCAYAQSAYYPLTSLTNASLPAVTISNLTTGTTYYFAVSAYNGLESSCSNEVSTGT